MPSNYVQGHAAESVAANYLRGLGYKIVDLNWKTRWCEIDIVAQMDESIFFVEVKYRKTTKQGGGLDYITPKKLSQMQFAAELWVSNHNWLGEYQLAAVELAGDKFAISEFVIL